MLQKLVIKNYALIESLSITPGDNLNIITGETGAGKSILLGALGLLLGNRADSKTLKNHDDKCVIEGEFDVSKLELKQFFNDNELDFETQTIIRREITVSGKSRSFVNDTPVTLDITKRLGEKLIDIHSQHQTILLKESSFQMSIIDSFAENQSLLKGYQSIFKEYKQAQNEFEELKKSFQQAQSELDYNNYLLNELRECNPQEGELEQLEKDVKLAEHSKEIKQTLGVVYQQVSESDNSISSQLYDLKHELEKVTSFSEEYGVLVKRLESITIELDDLSSEVHQKAEVIEFDGESIEIMSERLNLVNSLMTKHQVQTIDDLIAKKDELESAVQGTVGDQEKLNNLEKEIFGYKRDLEKIAQELSNRRKGVSSLIELKVDEELVRVGMPQASIKVELDEVNLNKWGMDNVEFKFSANKGIAPQNLGKVASGGEFSRLMFVLKYLLTDKTQLPTVIFDEIDTGVSGEIAIKMAEMMKEMSSGHQLFTITHLPQVAGYGENHFFVFKDQSGEQARSSIRELTSEERIGELAKMIGGDNPSAHAFESAKELLKG